MGAGARREGGCVGGCSGGGGVDALNLKRVLAGGAIALLFRLLFAVVLSICVFFAGLLPLLFVIPSCVSMLSRRTFLLHISSFVLSRWLLDLSFSWTLFFSSAWTGLDWTGVSLPRYPKYAVAAHCYSIPIYRPPAHFTRAALTLARISDILYYTSLPRTLYSTILPPRLVRARTMPAPHDCCIPLTLPVVAVVAV